MFRQENDCGHWLWWLFVLGLFKTIKIKKLSFSMELVLMDRKVFFHIVLVFVFFLF